MVNSLEKRVQAALARLEKTREKRIENEVREPIEREMRELEQWKENQLKPHNEQHEKITKQIEELKKKLSQIQEEYIETKRRSEEEVKRRDEQLVHTYYGDGAKHDQIHVKIKEQRNKILYDAIVEAMNQDAESSRLVPTSIGVFRLSTRFDRALFLEERGDYPHSVDLLLQEWSILRDNCDRKNGGLEYDGFGLSGWFAIKSIEDRKRYDCMEIILPRYEHRDFHITLSYYLIGSALAELDAAEVEGQWIKGVKTAGSWIQGIKSKYANPERQRIFGELFQQLTEEGRLQEISQYLQKIEKTGIIRPVNA